MKKLCFAFAIALTAFVYSSPSIASVDPIADLFDDVFQQEANLHPYNIVIHNKKYRAKIITNPIGSNVSEMISEHVTADLGSEWVPTALQIAHIESGGRCGAVNRSGATGVFQVINPERFGVSRSYARTCSGGIQAGVAHMAACIAKGARTSSQLMRCHNSGSPFGRVERAYKRYI